MEKKTTKTAGKAPATKQAAKAAPKAAPKAKEPQRQQVDLLDVLLDKDNRDPILLMDEKGRQMRFEQVAVIPYDVDKEDRKLYVVLKPIDKIEGIADDEAIVFVCDTDKAGNTVLRLEENEEIAIDVFDKYYDLLEEENAKQKAAKKTKAKEAAKTTKTATKKPATKTAGKKPAKK